MPSRQRPVLLAAGGTGGHLFPAEALGTALMQQGVRVELATDYRAKIYSSAFPEKAIHQLASATFKSRKPLHVLQAGFSLAKGMLQALWLLLRLRPSVVVGFGGYPTVPPVFIAQLLGIPTIVHEQNAVLGRANRFLAKRAKTIGTGFNQLAKATAEEQEKAVFIGNPLRVPVFEAAQHPYQPLAQDGVLNLLVTGGSQGARIMTEVVPAAVQRLDEPLRRRVKVTHQTRQDDVVWARTAYAAAGIDAEVAAFFKDLPQRIALSHLVIGRSGASTVAELAMIGRPSILVPLPGSLDQDQLANATILAALDAATVINQAQFTPDALAERLTAILTDSVGLARQANNARLAATPDAAQRLAALVVNIYSNHSQ